jgi:glucose-6-phosphate isomerase
VIHVGIGGSTTGPQLVCHALSSPRDAATLHFLDNSDPDGIDSVMDRLEGRLDETLVSVVSKCGYTPTPRYVGFELETIFERHGLRFADHAIATTMEGSDLDRRAIDERWLARIPMWDWVGGRTSVTSAVGLLPAALQGVDIRALLEGAAAMDRLTRQRELARNPSALLAAMWYWLGNGHGEKNMVVLPYKDRLALLPKYVQQLVMESIGKKADRSGAVVRQGLTVYGNKGSTDQHSYFQQLRDGANDFFVTFVHTLAGRNREAVEIMPGVTLDDYLYGSLEGSRNALHDRGRDSITISLPEISAHSVGMLIALFERAVCLYAELIDVNAYSQPGVDKHVADPVVRLQAAVLSYLHGAPPQTAEEIAAGIGQSEAVESIYKLLHRLQCDPARGVVREPGSKIFEERFSMARPSTIPD